MPAVEPRIVAYRLYGYIMPEIPFSSELPLSAALNSENPPQVSSHSSGVAPGFVVRDGAPVAPPIRPNYPSSRAATGQALPRRREAAHAGPRSEPSRPRGSAVAVVTWLFSVLAVLLALQYFVPRIVEETQYAATRGRQRAEYEGA